MATTSARHLITIDIVSDTICPCVHTHNAKQGHGGR